MSVIVSCPLGAAIVSSEKRKQNQRDPPARAFPDVSETHRFEYWPVEDDVLEKAGIVRDGDAADQVCAASPCFVWFSLFRLP